MPIRVKLHWSKFPKLTDARKVFPKHACVYVQADKLGHPLRVGMASKGLDDRYRGGNGYAVDASMHASGNLVFVASIDVTLCKAVEEELIWQGRRILIYNIRGKAGPPLQRVSIEHSGNTPVLGDFDSGA